MTSSELIVIGPAPVDEPAAMQVSGGGALPTPGTGGLPLAAGRVGSAVSSGDDVANFAIACALSGFFKDVRNASQAIVKMEAGRELGLGKVASISLIHIIEGRPTAGAVVLAAKIKTSKRYDYKVVRRDNEACVLEWIEDGEIVGQSSWNMEDARRAGLANKTNWKHHPRAMLFANALKEGNRVYCPDVCCGINATEEMAPDLELGEDGRISPEAWERVFAGQKLAQEIGEKEQKEKPMSALEAMQRAAGIVPGQPPAQQGVVANSAGAVAVLTGTTNPPYDKSRDNGFPCTSQQEEQIRTYCRAVNPDPAAFKNVLASYGATKISELTTAAADDVIAKLAARVAQRGMAGLQASQAAVNQAAAAADPNALANAEERELLRLEFQRIGADKAMLEKYLAAVGKATFRDFTSAEAGKLVAHLRTKPTATVPN